MVVVIFYTGKIHSLDHKLKISILTQILKHINLNVGYVGYVFKQVTFDLTTLIKKKSWKLNFVKQDGVSLTKTENFRLNYNYTHCTQYWEDSIWKFRLFFL